MSEQSDTSAIERRQRERMERALADRDARIHELQVRLAALEGSASLAVGRVLTEAARRPRRLPRLPGDLFRLWRGKGRGAASPPPPPDRPGFVGYDEDRLLVGYPGPPPERLVVAGVLGPGLRDMLDPYVHLVPLLPHDAGVVFDAVEVDLVLVTASAASVGSPWNHLGDPAALDRTRALGRVLASARGRGVPTVLWQDAGAPPGLATLDFDHVEHDDCGVALHVFNPVALDAGRERAPLYAGPGSALSAAPLAELRERGDLTALDPPWPGLAALLRRHTLALGLDPVRTVQHLASGSRVVALGARPRGIGTDGVPGEVLRSVDDPAKVAPELAAARAEPPVGADELRATLRALFLRAATPVRLSGLLARAGLTEAAEQVLSGRRVAVLARPADETEAERLADDLVAQLHQPAELVVPAAADFAAFDRLRSRGVTVRQAAEAPADGDAEPAPWAALAEAAAAEWVAPWHGGQAARWAPGHLADMVCAGECSAADAIGPALLPLDASGWDAAVDYAFTGAVEPALIRRTLARKPTPPSEWGRHGARLLALALERPN
ncbi:hypothetical protein [Allonocardiopsis opalescens]|uniref:Uncharacterized protein n=1 Tax=Allonocardiopsis opalescens TaxID=1144618 RepID=A0A2T0QC70_9ACTN|nr:hypothetical protein [Allonocardiopsis opalescens]PRY01470.1 hypothetical protein CLV72_10152 [Allonocardiopsis opalescens]